MLADQGYPGISAYLQPLTEKNARPKTRSGDRSTQFNYSNKLRLKSNQKNLICAGVGLVLIRRYQAITLNQHHFNPSLIKVIFIVLKPIVNSGIRVCDTS